MKWAALLFSPLLTWLLASAVPAADSLYPVVIDQDTLAGIVDLSALNHPLTAADRLIVREGHFFRVGNDRQPNTADDERVRLFGMNLSFGANFPEEKDAQRVARRLRRLGVNVVRLHHLDTVPDKEPATSNSLLTQGPYPTLNPIAIGRLRTFIAALKAEGIYVNLNLHVGYQFRPSVDGVPAIPEGVEFPKQSKPLHLFHPRMVELQAEYAAKIIEILGLNGDPVLAMVEINNESSLVQAWHKGELGKAIVSGYETELRRQWRRFLEQKYPNSQPDNALVGVSGLIPPTRRDDFLQFLIDRDRAYLERMLKAIREVTDQWVPVTGTQMGYGGLSNLDSHAALDYLDNHFYIDHHNFPNRQWDQRDWRIKDSAATVDDLAPLLNMAASRQAGRPYTISEFNQPWPNRQGAGIDPILAVWGAFQDWDAIMHFAYSHNRDWDRTVPNGFDLSGDWAKYPSFGQAAWLFRSGAIQAGRTPIDIPVSAEWRLQSGRRKVSRDIANFLANALRYRPEIAFVHPVRLVKDSTAPLPEVARKGLAAPYKSDTSEFSYDPYNKRFLIHVPKAAGVFGFLKPGQKVAAGAIELELASSARGAASILLTPRDDKPLAQSDRLLLTNPGYTLCTQPGSNPPRPQRLVRYGFDPRWWTLEPDPAHPDKPSGSFREGVGPVWMERVENFVTLHTSARDLRVYPLDGAGARLKPLPSRDVQRVNSGFRIHLQAEGQNFAPWYEIEAIH